VWVVVVGTLIGWVPWRLAGGSLAARWSGSPADWIGAGLMVGGLGLAGWCVALFLGPGRGTPLPLSPPQELVAVGPYRVIRNPMQLGMFLVLIGEALVAGTGSLWLYDACLAAGGWAFVRFWEEPDLRRRFGPRYAEYARRVPRRWVPQLPFSGAGRRQLP
jgi:protein-S-isoprenylcysteine O-methyltransferase Ste14